MKVTIDKISSSTLNAALTREVSLTPWIPAEAGTVVVGRVLNEKKVYNQLEDRHGRMMTLHAGDVIAGVLGSRRALRGYAGEVPKSVEVGDVLHLLNLGGVVGHCVSSNPQVGEPTLIEILGAPTAGNGVAASIQGGQVTPSATLSEAKVPVVWVAGSCMHAGKTAATCALVRDLSAQGLKVGVAKVTGVSLRRDSLEMLDHGAVAAYTFTDAGLPSTCDGEVVDAARGCLNQLASSDVDVAIVELGDGIMGDYGVMDILAAEDLQATTAATVFAATDPVAAWGGVSWLSQHGVNVDVITGPATDNVAGCAAISRLTQRSAFNARSHSAELAGVVAGQLNAARHRAA